MLRPALLALSILSLACGSRETAPASDAAVEAGAPDLARDMATDQARLDLPASDGAAPDGPARDVVAPDGPPADIALADQAAADLLAADQAAVDAGPACPAGKWCSTLYPPGWTPAQSPDSKGRYLHDFSYAGYQRGEVKLPTKPPGKLHDVVKAHAADNTGKKDATAAVQKAVDAASAAGGGVVYIPAGTYRMDGKITVKSSYVVLRGAGPTKTKLHFTSHKGMSYSSHITFSGKITRTKEIFLAKDGVARSKVVRVASAAGVKVGDEVSVGWVITPAFVKAHGMTGLWKPFYNQWKAMFRRTVVAVDTKATPHRVTLDIPLRYAAKVSDKASVKLESGYLRECGVESLGVSNAVKWKDAWANKQAHALGFNQVKDCWLRDVASVQSPGATGWTAGDKTHYHLQSGGVRVVDSKRVTISKCSFANPQNRGGGGNGYLVHITRSNEVLVADTIAVDGRHNLIQNWDFGTTGCVFLRCTSTGSKSVTLVAGFPVALPAYSEYHHSLAMANLVDSCTLNDGWLAGNRGSWSSGAGHTSTECAFWNNVGKGTIFSMQYGWGHVIGTGPQLKVVTSLLHPNAGGSKPEDFVEGKGKAATLWPKSLYEHQLGRRLAP